jgi:parallel beta-helix repeat protein
MPVDDLIIGKLLDRGGGGTYETAAYLSTNTSPTTVLLPGIWTMAAGEVLVSNGTNDVGASTTISATSTSGKGLRFVPGGLIRPTASTVTVTIDAPIDAGRWQIFDYSGGGKITLGPAAATGVRPEWFGAVGDGTTDDTTALQRMAAALPAGARVILSARYRITYAPPPVTQPPTKDEVIGIRITKNNVWVEGEGGAEIIMGNFDAAKAQEEPDDAGVDRFVAISFLGVSGGGVRRVRFSGEATAGVNDALNPRVFAKLHPDITMHFTSRAKAIGISNSSDISIRDVVGVKIVGNVVNARGDDADPAKRTYRASVIGCYAEGCSENGFNYMGGTYDCVFADNVAENNLFSGFESGTFRLTCTGNICRKNRKQGINHVGSYGTFTGNTLVDNTTTGFALQYQPQGPTLYGDQNVLSGNVIAGNLDAGISAAAGTRDNLISGNRFQNNGPATYTQAILLLGDTTLGTQGYVISGNSIAETRTPAGVMYGVFAQHAADLSITGNTFRAAGGYSVSAVGGSNHAYSGNVANRPANVNGTTVTI